jgi:hypothetical protein
MKQFFRSITLVSILSINSSCVSSSLHTVIKQLREENSSSNEVNVKALQQIKVLRIQQKVATASLLFSFNKRQSQLMPIEEDRLKNFILQPASKFVLFVAPATAKSSFEQVILATKRADEVFKLIIGHQKHVEVKFAPSQAVDTLKIVLES